MKNCKIDAIKSLFLKTIKIQLVRDFFKHSSGLRILILQILEMSSGSLMKLNVAEVDFKIDVFSNLISFDKKLAFFHGNVSNFFEIHAEPEILNIKEIESSVLNPMMLQDILKFNKICFKKVFELNLTLMTLFEIENKILLFNFTLKNFEAISKVFKLTHCDFLTLIKLILNMLRTIPRNAMAQIKLNSKIISFNMTREVQQNIFAFYEMISAALDNQQIKLICDSISFSKSHKSQKF